MPPIRSHTGGGSVVFRIKTFGLADAGAQQEKEKPGLEEESG
jgi:hypothetical protein